MVQGSWGLSRDDPRDLVTRSGKNHVSIQGTALVVQDAPSRPTS
ncbi:MAG TPA: hypothetical protein PLE12_09270 [Propionicimonas sp.]|nr:hypothetical protein [Propionicimonas sp.]